MTLEQATKYLQKNKELINMAEVAGRIDMDRSSLHRVVNDQLDARDRPVKIPDRCLPELKKIIKELQSKHI